MISLLPTNSHPLAAALVGLLLIPLAAAADDPPAVSRADTMVVVGEQVTLGEETRSVPPGADLVRILQETPFVMIRRGAASSSDLYADGLKRSDITVTVDGERTTTACPNRMDTRAGQLNLLDIERIDLARTGGGLQAGLGGKLAFRRRLPGREFTVYGRLMGVFGHAGSGDASLAVEGRRLRMTGRYRVIEAYEDADGHTFEDLYGYAETPTATVGEAQFVGAWDTGHAVAGYEASRDLLFPYLKMDERTNDLYQASASHRGHRLYVNYNDHFMDNALRTSATMTDMRTAATNLMMGVVGDAYEVYARNWDADNTITPLANPAMGTVNRMLPDVWRLYGSLHHTIGDPEAWTLSARLGVANTWVGDTSQADRYALLYPDAATDRWSVPFGATLGYTAPLSGTLDLGLSAEVSSDPPSPEEQFIAVDKPGANPTWLGNPDLADPVRATIRAALRHEVLRCEVFGSRLWEYPYRVRRMAESQPVDTYDGVGALLAGVHVGLDWTWISGGLAWNWGQKTADDGALAEIQPLTVLMEARSPGIGPARARLVWEAATRQDRVDASLDEFATDGWNRFDLAVDLVTDHWTVVAAVENLFNELYAQHLSYLRNPFASGVQVREPGRVLRLTATFRY